MEAFLHFVWLNKLYQKLIPKRAWAGASIEVLDVGTLNTDAGADFHNAKIKIDDLIWVGSVEIHESAHQWLEHKHDEDPSYNNVVLHIVENDDQVITLPNGQALPCCQMQIAPELRADIFRAFERKTELRCSEGLRSLLEKQDWTKTLEQLAQKRLAQKCELVENLWLENKEDWGKTLYALLLRYFGFGINNDAMECLARKLDMKLLLRHQGIEQEALILGQAGLIETIQDEAYREQLNESYRYLKHKYQLEPLSESLFKRLRTRPQNFPLQRLIQFLELISRLSLGADTFEACASINELHNLLRYGKAKLSKEEQKTLNPKLSKATSQMLIINVVVPFLTFSHSKLKRSEGLLKTQDLWRQLPQEQNKITRLFKGYGLTLRSASDSQALIYLYKEYCQKRKCFFCPWGRAILSHEVKN